jgi:aspartate ammonia-lyase
VAFGVIGNDHTICLASEAGQFELNVMEPVLAFSLLESLTIMANVFRVFRKYCVEGIQPNVERMQQYVEQSVGVITAINPHVGYETAVRITREAILAGKPVGELVLRDRVLSEERLKEILDPHQMTRPGIAGGKALKADRPHWRADDEADKAS